MLGCGAMVAFAWGQVQLKQFAERVGPVIGAGAPTIDSVVPGGTIMMHFQYYYSVADGLDVSRDGGRKGKNHFRAQCFID